MDLLVSPLADSVRSTARKSADGVAVPRKVPVRRRPLGSD